MHPLRWLGGGALFGSDDGPPRCEMCGLFVPPDDPDLLCGPCKVLRQQARERADREQREAGESGPPEDPVHRDGR